MTTVSAHYVFSFSIPASHPSLPGHFPGRPVVPGVLLLDEVIHGAEIWLQCRLRVRAVPQVKFVGALLPDEPAHVQLQLAAGQLRFSVRRSEQLLAQGVLGLDQ
jgi:3-hydroxyacyl-[acyl-carrier-protein] dehydratase